MFTKMDLKTRQRDGKHCDLCGCSFPAVRCDKCSSQIFCLSCDDMYHRHPKRKFHLRKAVDPTPTPQARPALPLKVSNLSTVPGDPSKMPLPPPRKKKPGKSIFDSFRRGSPGSDDSSSFSKKDYSWTDRLGSIKKFMSNRPLPPVPTDEDENDAAEASPALPLHNLSFIHRKVDEKPPALPQRSQPKPQVPLENDGMQRSNVEKMTNGVGSSFDSGMQGPAGIPQNPENFRNNQLQNFMNDNNVSRFGTLQRPNNSQHFLPMSHPAYPGDKSGGMHQSSSATDLTALPGLPGMQAYPQYPYNPHLPPQYPYPYPPMYPQFPPYAGHFGSSWANLNSGQSHATDGDFSDHSESSSGRVLRGRHHAGKDKKAKRSQSMLMDHMAFQSQFFPYGPYPPGVPSPWMPVVPSETPPSPSAQRRSSSRASHSRRRRKVTDDDDDDYLSSSPVSRPKSSSSEMSRNFSKIKSYSSSESSGEDERAEMPKAKSSSSGGKKITKQNFRRRSSSPRVQRNLSGDEKKEHVNHHKKKSKDKPGPTKTNDDSNEAVVLTEKLRATHIEDESAVNSSTKEETGGQYVPPSSWRCKHCTFINSAGERICQVCCRTATKSVSPVEDSPPEEKDPAKNESGSNVQLEQEESSVVSSSEKQDMAVLNSALDEAEKEINRSLNELLKVQNSTSRDQDIVESKGIQPITSSDSSAQTASIRTVGNQQMANKTVAAVSQGASQGEPRYRPAPRLDVSQGANTTSTVSPAKEQRGYTGNFLAKSSLSAQNNGLKISTGNGSTEMVEASEKATEKLKDSFCQTSVDDSSTSFQNGLLGYSGNIADLPYLPDGAKFPMNSINLQTGGILGDSGVTRGDNLRTGYPGMLYRSHSRASLFSGRMTDVASPFEYNNGGNHNSGLSSMIRSISRTSLLGDSEGWSPEYPIAAQKPKFYLSMEELVERRRQETMRAQGLELVRMIREAEQQGFTADDIQIALNNCGKQNPVHWLQDNWKNIIRTVVTLATNYGKDKAENDVGLVAENEARDALRLHKGNIWAAVTECVEGRQRKFLELSARGNFTFRDIIEALNTSDGDVEVAYSKLTNTSMKPFLMRIWGSGEGMPNLDGAMSPTETCELEGLNPEFLNKSQYLSPSEVSENVSWEEEYDGEDDIDWKSDDIPVEEDDEEEEPVTAYQTISENSLQTRNSDISGMDRLAGNMLFTPESDKSDYCDAFGTSLGERYLSSTSIDEIYLIDAEQDQEELVSYHREETKRKSSSGLLEKLSALRHKTENARFSSEACKALPSAASTNSLDVYQEDGDDQTTSMVDNIAVVGDEDRMQVEASETSKDFHPMNILKQTFGAIKSSVMGSTSKSDKSSPKSITEKRTIIVRDKIGLEFVPPSKPNDTSSAMDLEVASKKSDSYEELAKNKKFEDHASVSVQDTESSSIKNDSINNSPLSEYPDFQVSAPDSASTPAKTVQVGTGKCLKNLLLEKPVNAKVCETNEQETSSLNGNLVMDISDQNYDRISGTSPVPQTSKQRPEMKDNRNTEDTKKSDNSYSKSAVIMQEVTSIPKANVIANFSGLSDKKVPVQLKNEVVPQKEVKQSHESLINIQPQISNELGKKTDQIQVLTYHETNIKSSGEIQNGAKEEVTKNSFNETISSIHDLGNNLKGISQKDIAVLNEMENQRNSSSETYEDSAALSKTEDQTEKAKEVSIDKSSTSEKESSKTLLKENNALPALNLGNQGLPTEKTSEGSALIHVSGTGEQEKTANFATFQSDDAICSSKTEENMEVVSENQMNETDLNLPSQDIEEILLIHPKTHEFNERHEGILNIAQVSERELLHEIINDERPVGADLSFHSVNDNLNIDLSTDSHVGGSGCLDGEETSTRSVNASNLIEESGNSAEPPTEYSKEELREQKLQNNAKPPPTNSLNSAAEEEPCSSKSKDVNSFQEQDKITIPGDDSVKIFPTTTDSVSQHPSAEELSEVASTSLDEGVEVQISAVENSEVISDSVIQTADAMITEDVPPFATEGVNECDDQKSVSTSELISLKVASEAENNFTGTNDKYTNTENEPPDAVISETFNAGKVVSEFDVSCSPLTTKAENEDTPSQKTEDTEESVYSTPAKSLPNVANISLDSLSVSTSKKEVISDSKPPDKISEAAASGNVPGKRSKTKKSGRSLTKSSKPAKEGTNSLNSNAPLSQNTLVEGSGLKSSQFALNESAQNESDVKMQGNDAISNTGMQAENSQTIETSPRIDQSALPESGCVVNQVHSSSSSIATEIKAATSSTEEENATKLTGTEATITETVSRETAITKIREKSTTMVEAKEATAATETEAIATTEIEAIATTEIETKATTEIETKATITTEEAITTAATETEAIATAATEIEAIATTEIEAKATVMTEAEEAIATAATETEAIATAAIEIEAKTTITTEAEEAIATETKSNNATATETESKEATLSKIEAKVTIMTKAEEVKATAVTEAEEATTMSKAEEAIAIEAKATTMTEAEAMFVTEARAATTEEKETTATVTEAKEAVRETAPVAKEGKTAATESRETTTAEAKEVVERGAENSVGINEGMPNTQNKLSEKNKNSSTSIASGSLKAEAIKPEELGAKEHLQTSPNASGSERFATDAEKKIDNEVVSSKAPHRLVLQKSTDSSVDDDEEDISTSTAAEDPSNTPSSSVLNAAEEIIALQNLTIRPASPVRPVGPLRRMSFNTRREAIFLERRREDPLTATEEVRPWFVQKKPEPVRQIYPKRSIKQQLEFERKVRNLVAERKCRTYRKAEIVVQLMDMNFEEKDALYAASECSTFDMALSFLQQECQLCAGKYPVGEIVSMIHCEHKACKECIRAYFTIQIRDRTIMELLCPFCNEPDITDEDVAQDYFNHLDIMLKKLVDPEIHELFQRKLRDRVLMKDPNFRWCSQCSSGFIADPYLKKLMCPDCNAISCANCRRLWEKEHEGVSCEAFAEWKDANDPEAQTAGLAKLLTEDGIDCPCCHFRYSLAKGGCMHFKCIQCHHDFCSGCSRPFKMGQRCGVSEFCVKLGLHAHHPRNCLFYLRDKEPADLQRLLDMNDIHYNKEIPPDMTGQEVCQVLEQKETSQGMVDDVCGKEIQDGFAGLCRVHYVEYLGQLVNKYRIDPIQIFDNDDLELVLRRASIRLPPKKYRESTEEYRVKLVQLIEEKLPLVEVDGS